MLDIYKHVYYILLSDDEIFIRFKKYSLALIREILHVYYAFEFSGIESRTVPEGSGKFRISIVEFQLAFFVDAFEEPHGPRTHYAVTVEEDDHPVHVEFSLA